MGVECALDPGYEPSIVLTYNLTEETRCARPFLHCSPYLIFALMLCRGTFATICVWRLKRPRCTADVWKGHRTWDTVDSSGLRVYVMQSHEYIGTVDTSTGPDVIDYAHTAAWLGCVLTEVPRPHRIATYATDAS